jgi:multidrug resistance efflux pump
MSARDIAKKISPTLITLTLVVVAATAAFVLFRRYTDNPWTRDGQVRADIIKVAPRVDGYIVKVAVKNNQLVRKGELLFQIDESDYQLAVNKAQVSLDQAREDVEALVAAVRAAEATVKQRNSAVTSAEGEVAAAQSGITSAQAGVAEAESGITSAQAMIAQTKANLEESQREAERAQRLSDKRAGAVETAQAKTAAARAIKAQLDSANAGLTQAQATLAKAKAGEGEARAKLVIAQNGLAEAQDAVITSIADRDKAKANLGQPGEANVRIRQAKVQLEEANLKLQWTTIDAPSDGYITNLYVSQGTYAVTGSPLVAFVDSNTFRVHAYFKETKLKHIKKGNRAIVTLMSHHDQPIAGVVDTIGSAVNPPDIASTEGEVGVVPQIQPTFDWVRLAQRVPVTIRLEEVPDNIQLVSGTTASISIQPSKK